MKVVILGHERIFMRKFIIGLVIVFGIFLSVGGCGSSSISTALKHLSINKSAYTKNISFYVWDGIDGIDNIHERTLAYQSYTLYLNPVDNGEDKLEANAQKAQAKGAQVWYLISQDPSLEYIRLQVDRISQYNNQHEHKIIGMDFDIEPWVDFKDQNSTDNQKAWRGYLDYLQQAKQILEKASLKLSVSIPFWLDRQTEASPNNRPINYDIIDIADEVIIMAYTIYPQRIIPYTKSSLDYADQTGKSIKIALEMTDSTQEKDVSFYTHPEDINKILNIEIDHVSFGGYVIHAFQSFMRSNVSLE